MLRTTISRLACGATAALLMLSLAGPALAGHDDDWGDGRDRRAYPVHRHGDHCDRDWDRRDRDRDHDRGGWDRDHRGGHRGYYDDRDRRYDRSSYGCRPCGRRWRDRDGFVRHLRHHHHGFRG